MIEILIVMAIIAIIAAVVANPVRNAKQGGQRRQAVEAAKTLAEAIDRFRLDHGERPPVLGNATDWPTASAGPRNALTNSGYLKAAPEALQDGLLTIGTTNGSANSWRLVYRATTGAPHGFRIDVIHNGSAAGKSCTIVFDAAPASIVPGGTLPPC